MMQITLCNRVVILGLCLIVLCLIESAAAVPPTLFNPLLDPPALMRGTGEQMVTVSVQASDQDGDLDRVKVKRVRAGQKNELLGILTIDPTSIGQFRTPTFIGHIPIDTEQAQTITLQFVAKDLLKEKSRVVVPLPVRDVTSSWVNIGPSGGRINAIAIDPLNPTTVYTAIPSGVYKSTDGAASWAVVSRDMIAEPVLSLAIDPKTPSTIYAGTQNVQNCTVCGSFGADVFKSTDGGRTWNASKSALQNRNIFSIVINPEVPTTLYAATIFTGVFKSTDGGTTWTSSVTNNTGEALAIDPTAPTTIYSASREGVFKSINGGDTWSVSDTGLQLDRFNEVSIAIDPVSSSTLYVSTSFGLFKSLDAGDTWNVIQTTHSMNAVAVDPITPTTVYAGTWFDGVFKSVDAGDTWHESNVGIRTTRVRVLAVDPVTPTTVYAGTVNSGVYESMDEGETWTARSTGLPSPHIGSMAIDPVTQTTLYIGTNGNGIFKSVNGGETWEVRTVGLRTTFIGGLVIDPVTPPTIYAGTNIGAFKTEDGGDTWRELDMGVINTLTSILAVDPVTPSIVYGTISSGHGFFKSMDAGDTWIKVETTGLPSEQFNVLVVDPVTPSTLYGSTDQGGVFKSTNGGESWSSKGLTNHRINALVLDPMTPGTLYVSVGNGGGDHPTIRAGVFKSFNDGETWKQSQAGLPIPNDPFSSLNITLAIDPNDPSFLYAGLGRRGIYQSVDGGTTWEPTVGISGSVNALVINPMRPTIVYAGTDRGVFQLDQSRGRDE